MEEIGTVEVQRKYAVTYNRVSPTKHIKKEGVHASLLESENITRNRAESDGFTVVAVYSDEYISGKDNTKMQRFQDMMDAARRHEFDKIYVRRVNRFGRHGIQLAKAVIELYELGIHVCFIENSLDTSMPFGRIIIELIGELAQMERETIVENTTRGREEAIAAGKRFGPKKKDIDVKALRRLRLAPVSERPTWKQLEEMFDANRATLIQRLKDNHYWDEQKRTVI